jgi:hypothetical protein
MSKQMSSGAGAILHDAFASGDYLSAARQSPRDSWQHWASLALLGRPHAAIEELSRCGGDEAAFYTAVARWMAGDDDAALDGLHRLRSEHAQRLAALVRKQPITVLAQLPWNRGGSWDLLTALRDPAFRVFNISFHPDDIQNRPYADVHALVPTGVTPDFYVAAMLEWHLIPPNVRELGCPVVGHSSDFDLHIQAVAPWLGLFDELVVLDRTEWESMRGLVSVPVSTFPKVFGVPAGIPDPVDAPRPDDVFVSGTLIHPYHRDKDAMLLELLRLGDVRLRLVNGFESAKDYYRSLAAAKVCCSYVRHPGSMPTRGLEALAAGCVVAVQEESALRLFAGEDEGVVPYGGASGRLSTCLAGVLGNWNDHARSARRGAARIKDEFALSRVASEYFRFLTFLAARPRAARPGIGSRLIQKRPIVQKGWLPSYRFGGALLTAWAADSVARLDEQIADAESPGALNDRARELLLAHYHDPHHAAWLPAVIEPLERAVSTFPDALVPRLNLIRIVLHYGGPESVDDALKVLDDTLARVPDLWQVGLLDDVLPWDFCPSLFDYRQYFDTLTHGLCGKAQVESELVSLILAALHHYRARVGTDASRRVADAAGAVQLNSIFAEYVLFYCRLLLERGHPPDLEAAAVELQRLSTRSVRLLEVADLARALPRELCEGWVDDLERLVRRFWHATTVRECFLEPPLRSAAEAANRLLVEGTP